MTMPGKKPATNERPSNPDCVWIGAAGHEVACEAEAGSEADGVGRAVDVGVEDGEVVSLEHIPPLHE
jgi:hypothetical protein